MRPECSQAVQKDSCIQIGDANEKRQGERRLAVLLDDHALPNVGYPTTTTSIRGERRLAVLLDKPRAT